MQKPDQNPRIRTLKTTETSSGLTPRSSERRSGRRVGLPLAIGGGVLAVVAAAVAIPLATGMFSDNDNAGATPPPKPTTEPTVVETQEPTSGNFEVLDKMSFDEFRNQDIAARGEWCLTVADDISKLATSWGNASDNPLDVLPKGSHSNTPQEKIQIHTMMERMAYVAHDDNMRILTQDEAYKMISCGYVDTDSPEAQIAYETVDTLYAANGHGYPAATYAEQGAYQMSEVVSFDPETTTAGGETSQFITLSTGRNNEYVSVTTKDAQGKDTIIYAIN